MGSHRSTKRHSVLLTDSVGVAMATLGGVHDAKGIENSVEIEELARFAVEEQNKKANTLLEFVRVVKVKEQVVSGIIYYITIEAIDGGEKKLYEAKVWVKPWMKFKELQEFIPLDDCSSEIEAPKED